MADEFNLRPPQSPQISPRLDMLRGILAGVGSAFGENNAPLQFLNSQREQEFNRAKMDQMIYEANLNYAKSNFDASLEAQKTQAYLKKLQADITGSEADTELTKLRTNIAKGELEFQPEKQRLEREEAAAKVKKENFEQQRKQIDLDFDTKTLDDRIRKWSADAKRAELEVDNATTESERLRLQIKSDTRQDTIKNLLFGAAEKYIENGEAIKGFALWHGSYSELLKDSPTAQERITKIKESAPLQKMAIELQQDDDAESKLEEAAMWRDSILHPEEYGNPNLSDTYKAAQLFWLKEFERLKIEDKVDNKAEQRRVLQKFRTSFDREQIGDLLQTGELDYFIEHEFIEDGFTLSSKEIYELITGESTKKEVRIKEPKPNEFFPLMP